MTKQELINAQLTPDATAVTILDQTLLPNDTKYLTLRTPGELFEAIYMLRVRGAPAIGIFAAYALFVLAQQIKTENTEEFISQVMKYSTYLNSSRPTAVNLETQLRRMTDMVQSLASEPVGKILDAMKNEAIQIHEEDKQMCRAISQHGLTLLRDSQSFGGSHQRLGIMTQCNAGPLATSQYGTALGPIIMGHEQGMKFKAYICETRPLMQGARLTAFELVSAGIDSTLICDNMASIVMSEGKINAVLAGCDRIAANGDVANKVGTSGLAILAKHYGIPFYILGPSTTIDKNCPTGADIEIEQREPGEIKKLFFEKPIAPDGVKCYNPAFDVTPNNLITAIITETGIHSPASLRA